MTINVVKHGFQKKTEWQNGMKIQDKKIGTKLRWQ